MSQKTIKVNPEFFNFSNGGSTRKKREKPQNEIKVKPKLPKKNETLKKQSLLRMIRKHQQDKYKDAISKPKLDINDSFTQTKDFLNSLSSKNRTFKQEPTHTVEVDTLKQELDEIHNRPEPVHMHTSTPNVNAQPRYGCLKNGTLPTYRMTMKNTDTQPLPQLQQLQQTHNHNNIITPEYRRYNPESRALEHLNNEHMRQKQKKIYRRTYNVGKYKSRPQISVLISNKKIRTNVTMKLQETKNQEIGKIRKELIKRGLIRVGTITPENVLRQMYESVSMLCGDVKNHNPDNLLYNYFHND